MLKCFEGLNDLMMVGQSVIYTRCKTIKNTFIKYFTLIIFHIRKTAIITSLIIKKTFAFKTVFCRYPFWCHAIITFRQKLFYILLMVTGSLFFAALMIISILKARMCSSPQTTCAMIKSICVYNTLWLVDGHIVSDIANR